MLIGSMQTNLLNNHKNYVVKYLPQVVFDGFQHDSSPQVIRPKAYRQK